MLTTPNLISLTRVPLAIAFVLLPDTAVRIALVVAAGATDWLDGWWARTRGPTSASGALIDPATDKIFVISALVGFVTAGVLNIAQLAILLARDLFVAASALAVLMLKLPVRLTARFPGKLLTNIQIAAVIILLLAPNLDTLVVAVAGVVSIWAIVDYAMVGLRSLRQRAALG